MNKKIVHILLSFSLFLTFLVGSLSIFSYVQSPQVFAQDFKIPFAEKDSGYGYLRNIEYQDPTTNSTASFDVRFPTIAGLGGETQAGSAGIVILVKRIVKFLQYVFGSIGVLYIIIASYRLLVSGGHVDEEITKQKETLKWIAIGFVVITISDMAISKVFFRDEGGFLSTPETAKTAALAGVKLIKQVVDFFVAFVGTVAVLTIVISGMRMVMSPGNEEVMTAQKKIFMWAAVGLIIITLSDRIVYIFYGEGGAQGINVRAGLVEIAGLTNYILGFMGAVAAASLIYAGVILLVNYGNSEAVGKAKTVVRDVIIGLVIAFSAYTIVSAVVRLGA